MTNLQKILNAVFGNWMSTAAGTALGGGVGAAVGYHNPDGSINWWAVLILLLGFIKGAVTKDSTTGSQPS